MNFSEVFKLSNQLCSFSPDGKYLASCVQYRLVIRDVNTLQILHLYTCLDQIQHVEWSADSMFILCAMYKRGIVQVWSLEQSEWHCKIDEGSAGLVSSCWSPDGRHILNTTEFHLRITLWSLSAKSVSYIKYPKACQQGITFTKDGRHMALAERRDCTDYVSIFVCNDWRLLRHFETETQDLTGIEWAPNGCVLAVWDTCLEYKMLLYSLDGRLLSSYRAYEWSLGIKSVAWSPSSQFLAVGSFDEKVRILNHVTWKPIKELSHPATVNHPKAVVYKELERCPGVATDELMFPLPKGKPSSLFSVRSKYEIADVPVTLRVIKPDTDRANPELGVGMLAFSPDNRYLASRNDNMPCSVWIWDVQKMRLFAVLEQTLPVRSFLWDPIQPRLAVCTGNSKVYLWSPAGSVSVPVPTEGTFNVLSMSWHPMGEDTLLLMSKDHLCLCYLETEDDDDEK
ncbi:WD repeat-containing protein WRAP73 [Spea bombifrons]|uniref:WD repeat-containing protein WRAP73 n=1 Tax=Spea bombifrons TaxID=233779 RepID=UPI00234BD2AC|nr:WD repeat-containing protein WRAP73 [Spea bombifrons]